MERDPVVTYIKESKYERHIETYVAGGGDERMAPSHPIPREEKGGGISFKGTGVRQ